MGLEKFKKPVNLPVRICFIILLMFIAQGVIVELFLFSVINNLMSGVPVKILPRVSGILLHFNHYYLPIFLLTSFIFAMGMFILVKKLVAPVERIKSVSREIVSGVYSKRINLRKGDDLYEIAGNINTLAEKLEELESYITQVNESLEQYSKIGFHLCNIIGELNGLSEKRERSLQEDRKKIAELCNDIEEKRGILKKGVEGQE